MNDIFYFIGFMGAGKTSLARETAESLELPWADLDSLIEDEYDMELSEIFRDHGEAYFRTLESEVLREISRGPLVLASGGGTPCTDDNFNYMSQHGILIYLEAPFETLYRRIKDDGNRPLLRRHSKNQLHQLFNERLSYYERAEYQVDVDRDKKQVTEDLIELIWSLLTDSFRSASTQTGH